MTRTLRIAGLAVALPLALSACGGGGGSNTSTTSPPAVATFASKFGTSFNAFFGTSADTTDANVKDPTAADVPPLSLSTEPLDN